jgi:RNA-directed DNA polymerase
VRRPPSWALEPKGKLDTEPVNGAARAVSRASAVNGPEGEALDWPSIDWRAVERTVRRLRQRIFTASWAGDLKKVRSLQKLMLRSPGQRAAERTAGHGG